MYLPSGEIAADSTGFSLELVVSCRIVISGRISGVRWVTHQIALTIRSKANPATTARGQPTRENVEPLRLPPFVSWIVLRPEDGRGAVRPDSESRFRRFKSARISEAT